MKSTVEVVNIATCAQYQTAIRRFAVYPQCAVYFKRSAWETLEDDQVAPNYAYAALGLFNELAEFMEKLRGGACDIAELGDVAWYIADMHTMLGTQWNAPASPAARTGSLRDKLWQTCLDMACEIGALQGLFKKFIRQDGPLRFECAVQRIGRIAELWHEATVHGEVDWLDVLQGNFNKLNSRALANTLKGDGDNR